MESTLAAFMAETRITLQNLDDRMRNLEHPGLLPGHSTPSSGNTERRCTPTSTPSTSSELQSLKVLTPSTRSKVSQLLDTSTERHKAALKIFALHFSKEELATSNCSGTSEKKQLDPKRLAVVKQIVMEKFPPKESAGETAESVWKNICKRLDTKCRGQKFAEKYAVKQPQ